MNALILAMNGLGSIFWMLLYFDQWSARHYLWQWLSNPDWGIRCLGLFVVLCLATPPTTVWWLWHRVTKPSRQDEDFFAPPDPQWDNPFAETYEQQGSNLLLKLVLVSVVALAIAVFAVTRPQAQQAAAPPPALSSAPMAEAPVVAPPPTNPSDPPGCDPTLVWEVYDPGWDPTQGPHIGQAIDVGAGAGVVIHAPICGWVRYNGMGGVDNANTMFVVDNSIYSVLLFHGVYDPNMVVGSAVTLGQAIGTESNIGWTYTKKINDLGEEVLEYCGAGSSCGYHTHISVWDARIGAEVDISTIWLPRGVYPTPVPPPPPTVQAPPSGAIAPLFTREVQHWAPQIIVWAAEFGIDPNMAATVMQIESCGDPNAVSSSNAQGLFQVMPFHFDPGEVMQDPNTNARRGMAYLATGMKYHNGDTSLTFAGYNGGHGTARKAWDLWPNEMQRYYHWATGIYADAQAGSSSSATLEQWLQAGGASLCQQAANRLGLQ